MKCPHGEEIKLNKNFGISFYLHEDDGSYCDLLNENNVPFGDIESAIISNYKINIHLDNASIFVYSYKDSSVAEEVIEIVSRFLRKYDARIIMRIINYWGLLGKYNAINLFCTSNYKAKKMLKVINCAIGPESSEVSQFLQKYNNIISYKHVIDRIESLPETEIEDFVIETNQFNFANKGIVDNFAQKYFKKYLEGKI